jgi:hypothetical protein
MKSVLGISALWESGWSTSRLSSASAALSSEYLQELERSVANTVRGVWPGTPVVVVIVAGRAQPSVSAKNMLLCVGKSSIVLGNRAGNAAAVVARAIESARQPGNGPVQAVQPANSRQPESGSTPSVAQPLDEGGAWSLRLLDGTKVIDRWKPRSTGESPADAIAASVAVSGTSDGLRINYTFRNDGQSARAMASLELPPMLLGERIVIRDFRELGDGMGIDARSNGWAGVYPADLYCPAIVATNDRIAIGVAIQYPMLEYRHEIRVGVAPEKTGSWRPVMAFANNDSTPYEQRIQFCGVIQPGESKSYRVDIRVTGVSDWPRTLEPYRDFLRSTYGAVAYTRDLRPVAGVSMAMGELQSATNPYGWVPEAGDPAIDGYLRGSRHIAAHFNCADRVMVWTPTGLSANGPITYPFQFASGLRTYGASLSSSSQFESGAARLRGIATAERDLGLWWGRSANVERYWNGSGSSEPINPANSEHLALAWAELDAAAETGARTIGLDAFAHTLSPAWNLWPMLKAARMRHPQLKFVTEGRSCDVLHLIAPTWCDGYRYRPVAGRQERIPVARFEIADYLAAGHETWVGMQFDRSRNPRLWGANCSLGAQLEEIRQVAKLGYVPVSWLPVDLRQIAGP